MGISSLQILHFYFLNGNSKALLLDIDSILSKLLASIYQANKEAECYQQSILLLVDVLKAEGVDVRGTIVLNNSSLLKLIPKELSSSALI